MKKRAVLSMLMAGLMTGFTALSLASCGSSSDGSGSGDPSSSSTGSQSASSESSTASVSDSEEPVTINMMITVSAEGSGADRVREEADQLAMEEMNMHLNLQMETFGSLMNTLNLQMAANEGLDLIPMPSSSLTGSIDSGYLLNLNDYLDQLGDAIEVLGEDAYAAYFPEDDFLAGLPLKKERVNPVGIVMRHDLLEEAGISAEDIQIDPDNYDSYSQLDDVFAAVKALHPDMTMVGGSNLTAGLQTTWVDGLNDWLGVLENYGQTTTVTNWYESDQFYNFCKIERRWFEAGYESADVSTTTDTGTMLMRAGNLFSYFTNIKPNTNIEVGAQTGYDVDVVQIAKKGKYSSNIIGCIYALSTASENPEKAAEFMNWAYTSGKLNDLINWGVEGIDWEEKPDGTAGYPDGIDASSVSYHQDFGWIYPNQMAGHPWEGNDPDVWEQYDVFNTENVLPSKANGFNYNGSSVADQVAACSSVVSQYYNDLTFGAIDIDTGIKAFNDALYSCGLQDILDEKQRQFDAWLASEGK